jgi:hypothetical protein
MAAQLKKMGRGVWQYAGGGKITARGKRVEPVDRTSFRGHIILSIWFTSRSQRPRGLKHESPSPARTLGSWVRMVLKAWLSVCVYSVFALFCGQVEALRRADLLSKESYRLCIVLRILKSGQGPKGCRAIGKRNWFTAHNKLNCRKRTCFPCNFIRRIPSCFNKFPTS